VRRRKKVHWLRWFVYFIGRALELIGLLLVTWAMFLVFGTPDMKAMLSLTAAGLFVFAIGWLLARKNPQSG
jgi:hypothetical protein